MKYLIPLLILCAGCDHPISIHDYGCKMTKIEETQCVVCNDAQGFPRAITCNWNKEPTR